MKSNFVVDLEPNQVITTSFLVQSKEVRFKKTGEPYLALEFADRTGTVEAKMWENVAEVEATFDRDDFVKVKGLVEVYRNKPQLTIHKLRRLDESEVDFADYFPHTTKDVEAMYAEILGILEGFSNPHLKQLLLSIFGDEEIAAKFKQAPAAKTMHHARLGGLLEHVLSLCQLCQVVGPHYEGIDMDLLLTGALLHDIGKIEELEYARSFGYTTRGQLLGHIVIELEVVNKKIAAIEDFPVELKMLVEHMLVSHHGSYEFGSPKLPMFPEALLLHYLDNLDSKMESVLATIRTDPSVEGSWTRFNPALGRVLLKRSKLTSREEPAPAPPVSGTEEKP